MGKPATGYSFGPTIILMVVGVPCPFLGSVQNLESFTPDRSNNPRMPLASSDVARSEFWFSKPTRLYIPRTLIAPTVVVSYALQHH